MKIKYIGKGEYMIVFSADKVFYLYTYSQKLRNASLTFKKEMEMGIDNVCINELGTCFIILENREVISIVVGSDYSINRLTKVGKKSAKIIANHKFVALLNTDKTVSVLNL